MLLPDRHVRARESSIAERRGSRWLLIWGDLGQWLVVDDEAERLIRSFNTRIRVTEGLRSFSRGMNDPGNPATENALSILARMHERGLLESEEGTPRIPEEPRLISNITCNITDACNLRCPWCYNTPSQGGDLSASALAGWLGSGHSALAEDASFFVLGGEPFLAAPRLAETLDAIREHIRGEVLVSTNGTIRPDSLLNTLLRTKTTVQISLDGSEARTHDAIRGDGVFARAIDTAGRLVDAGVHTVLSMVITRESTDEIEAYFDLALRLGAHEVRFIPLRRIGRGAHHSGHVPGLLDSYQSLLRTLRRRPGLRRMLSRDFYSILLAACRFSRLRDNCGIARRILFIDGHGDLFPCPNHRDAIYLCGNVRNTPLSGLLDQSDVLIRLRTSCRVDRIEGCRDCPFRYWCAGDCRAEAMAVTGSNGPSPYCGELRSLIPEMFWQIADGVHEGPEIIPSSLTWA